MKVFTLAVGLSVLGSACAGTGAALPAAPATVPMAAVRAADLDAFCGVFRGIGASGDMARHNNGSAAANERAWEGHIRTAERIADVAPAEVKTQAQTYVTLVQARAGLSAAHGDADVSALPPEATRAFISQHAADQQQANQLISFATSNCQGLK